MLRGEAAHAESVALALDEPGTHAARADAITRATSTCTRWRARCAREPRDAAPVRRITIDDVWDGFALWLGLHDARVLPAHRAGPGRREQPRAEPRSGQRRALRARDDARARRRRRARRVRAARRARRAAAPLRRRPAGAVGARAAAIAGWDDAGRPGNASLRVTIDPAGTAHVAFGAHRGDAP